MKAYLGVLVALGVFGGVAVFSYRAGADSVRAEYAQKLADSVKNARKMQASLDEYVAKYEAEAAKKQRVRTVTVETVRRETAKLPVRDCGWTHAEWVQLGNAYCAAFPDVPGCLHEGLLRSAPDVPAAGRSVPQDARNPVDAGLRDLSGREAGVPEAPRETTNP